MEKDELLQKLDGLHELCKKSDDAYSKLNMALDRSVQLSFKAPNNDERDAVLQAYEDSIEKLEDEIDGIKNPPLPQRYFFPEPVLHPSIRTWNYAAGIMAALAVLFIIIAAATNTAGFLAFMIFMLVIGVIVICAVTHPKLGRYTEDKKQFDNTKKFNEIELPKHIQKFQMDIAVLNTKRNAITEEMKKIADALPAQLEEANAKFEKRCAEIEAMHNEKYKEDIAFVDKMLSDSLDAANAIGEELKKQDFIAEKYRNTETVVKLKEYLQNGRADSLKEALNLFEAEQRFMNNEIM